MEISVDQITYLIGLVAGVVGMPVIDAVKKAFGVNGRWALGIASVVSIGLGVLVMALSGSFTGVEVTLENIIAASTGVFSVATILYKAMQADVPK